METQERNTMALWYKIYSVYQIDQKKGEEMAIEALTPFMMGFVNQASRLGVRDAEDLFNSLCVILLNKLKTYCPIDKSGTETMGLSYMRPYFLEAFSDFTRGGDGLGHGAIPKYRLKKGGKVNFHSIDDTSENSVIHTPEFNRHSIKSAEDVFFENFLDSDLILFQESTKGDSPNERRRKFQVYKKLSELEL